MRVFVAGATGVIGRRLVPLLVRNGHQVIGMTRSKERAEMLRGTGADALVCDVFDADAVEKAMTEAKPDALIHELTDLPKRLEPRKYAKQLAGTNRVRREGTRNLVAAARAAGVKRIVAQSIAFAYA
ncbi:MAG: SDR family NAD(P)-dependent oxidoreductase, partial [Solirubrobacterales bacterium]|nr:SDR family NAD(P)-dependent oxidoreductase [Solirubrobacterales bacterium]